MSECGVTKWNVFNFVISIAGMCLNIVMCFQRPFFRMAPLIAILLMARAVRFGLRMKESK
jgi:hypothetical protein